MEISKAEGWDVYGTELSSWAASIARQAGFGPVYEGTLEQVNLPARGFDVITAWDVIEHVSQPATMLDEIAILLKPGGLLVLSTYVVDSWPVRILGTRYPFFMDMHLIHFSRATLKRMLFEHGYEILCIRPHQRVISLQYFLERIEHILPVGRRLIRWFANQRQVKKRFVKVGLSGLVNIFARLMKSS
jgi:SAM-dependent methyltransferase